jgi:hypothetical protein
MKFPHLFILKSHVELREIVISSAKGLLQHNLPLARLEIDRYLAKAARRQL